MMRVGGIVLCGGESRRMEQPKAWLPFGGERMLQRVVRIVSEAVAPVVVVAAPDQEIPPLPSAIRLVRDEERGRGPLQGLAAGLVALEGHVEAAFVAGCDAPFLKPEFLRRMIDLLGDHALCVPFTDGFHHPLAAVYRIETLAAVRRLLQSPRSGPVALFATEKTRLVREEELRDVDAELASLCNLNSPDDYAAALARLAQDEARNSPTT